MSKFSKATLLKSHFGMGGLLYICCIFSEHLFLRTPVDGCFLMTEVVFYRRQDYLIFHPQYRARWENQNHLQFGNWCFDWNHECNIKQANKKKSKLKRATEKKWYIQRVQREKHTKGKKCNINKAFFFLFTYLDLELTNENITVQKIKFWLRVSSVNVKTFQRKLLRKLHFLCSAFC